MRNRERGRDRVQEAVKLEDGGMSLRVADDEMLSAPHCIDMSKRRRKQ